MPVADDTPGKHHGAVDRATERARQAREDDAEPDLHEVGARHAGRREADGEEEHDAQRRLGGRPRPSGRTPAADSTVVWTLAHKVRLMEPTTRAKRMYRSSMGSRWCAGDTAQRAGRPADDDDACGGAGGRSVGRRQRTAARSALVQNRPRMALAIAPPAMIAGLEQTSLARERGVTVWARRSGLVW